MDIADRIKLVRGKISQDDFAQQLGVHKSSLGRYERGDSIPDMEFAQAICSKFDISPQWFLLGTGSKSGQGDDIQGQDGDLKKKIAELEVRLEERQTMIDRLLELHKGGVEGANADTYAPGAHFSGRGSRD